MTLTQSKTTPCTADSRRLIAMIASFLYAVTALACSQTPTALGRDATPEVVSVNVVPGVAALEASDSLRFFADIRDQSGRAITTPVSWQATGGTINGQGVYVAGAAPGEYEVRAISIGQLIGAARIRIEALRNPRPVPPAAPRVVAVRLEPQQARLNPGATQTFAVTLLDSLGRVMSGDVTWQVAGGSMSANQFTAGSAAGSFQLVARNGLASASATVEIAAPAPVLPAGVPIAPGQSIQAAVNSHPAGTTFVIRAGTHRRQTVQPKDGMTFVGEAGAVLDGENSTRHAFEGRARNVTIRGLVIEKYSNPAQEGAIHGGGHSAAELSTGWLVENNEVRYNGGTGIRVGHRMRVAGNNVHHNEQMGIGGLGDDIVIEDNEIAWNNYRKAFDYGWEAGGTKFVKTRNLVVRNNHSHHNWGPGLWTDIDNINTTYEGNVVEDNADTGIFHEISYAAVIRNNVVRRNGFDKAAWAYGAGILIAHSPDVQVYGNTVENNYNGIIGIQQDRGSGAYGPHTLANLYVHDNTVIQRVGQWAAGAAQDVGDGGFFGRNIRFERNRYTLDTGSRRFEWENGQRTVSQWIAYGLDVSGSFN
ncbi:MAG: nitrous oxide reductase family maturation protein NosD [Gemmatimonadota bacterium]